MIEPILRDINIRDIHIAPVEKMRQDQTVDRLVADDHDVVRTPVEKK